MNQGKLLKILLFLCLLWGWVPDAAALEIGFSGGVYSAAGNLDSDGIPFDAGVHISPEYRSFANWKFEYTYFNPKLASSDSLKEATINAIWLMRRMKLEIHELRFGFTAGLGMGYVSDESKTGKTEYGSLGFRSDITLETLSIGNYQLETGVSFRGMPLRESGKYTDRFGLILSINKRFP